MKQFTLFIIMISLLLGTITSAATAETGSAKTVKGVRVVVDGKVNTVTALLYKNDWYLKPAEIKTLLGKKANLTPTLKGYANLRNAAKLIDSSYEHDGVLGAAYIWTEETYSDNINIDYDRGVSLGLVPSALQAKQEKAITTKEFASLLTTVIKKCVPSKLSQFNKNVKPALTSKRTLRRGEGFVMAYYAAECLGLNYSNNNFDHFVIPEKVFWNADQCDFDSLFPYLWNGPVRWNNEGNDTWDNYFIAAFLWSMGHSSPYSGVQIFEYDAKKNSMRPNEI